MGEIRIKINQTKHHFAIYYHSTQIQNHIFMSLNYEDYETGAINPILTNDQNTQAQHSLFDQITDNHNKLKKLIQMIDNNKTLQINPPLSFNINASRKRSTDRSNKSKQPRERLQSKSDLIQIQHKLNEVMQLVNNKIQKNMLNLHQSTIKRVADLKDIKNILQSCTKQQKSNNIDINIHQTEDKCKEIMGNHQKERFNLNFPQIQHYDSANSLVCPQQYAQKTQKTQLFEHTNIQQKHPLSSIPLEQSFFVQNINPSKQLNLLNNTNNNDSNLHKNYVIPQCSSKDVNILQTIMNINPFQYEQYNKTNEKTTQLNRPTSSFTDMYKQNQVSNRPYSVLNRSQSLPNHQQFHQTPLLVTRNVKNVQGQQKITNSSFANSFIHKMESQVRFPVPYLFIEQNPHKIIYPKISFKTKKKFSFNQYLHNNMNIMATKNQTIPIIQKQDESKIGLLSSPKPINKSSLTFQNPFILLNSNERQQNTIKNIIKKDSSRVVQNELKKIVEIDENNQNSRLKQIGYIDSDDSQIVYYTRLPQSSQFSENNGHKLKKRGIQLTNRGFTSQYFNKR